MPFQSTRPHGARHVVHNLLHHLQFVSIHAPAWGATSNLTVQFTDLPRFNPRARMGRDGQVKAFIRI